MFLRSIYMYRTSTNLLAPLISAPAQMPPNCGVFLPGNLFNPSVSIRFRATKDGLLQDPEKQPSEIFQRSHQKKIDALEERNELRAKRNLFTESNQARLDQLNRQFCEMECNDTLKRLKEQIAQVPEEINSLYVEIRKIEREIKVFNSGLSTIQNTWELEHRQQPSPSKDLNAMLENPEQYLQESNRIQEAMDTDLETRKGPTKEAIATRQSNIREKEKEIDLLEGKKVALELIHGVTEKNGLNFGFFDLPKKPVSDVEGFLNISKQFNKEDIARGFLQTLLDEELFRDNPEVFLKAWIKSYTPYTMVCASSYLDHLFKHFEIPLPALGWLFSNTLYNQKTIRKWESSLGASKLIKITEGCKPLVLPFMRVAEMIRMLWRTRNN